MRQIYSSPRIENVQRVVALLSEHGIETSIQNRRDYQGADWKRFSYSRPSDREAWPQVSITRAEDLTAARRLLRESGIEPSTRFADELAAARSAGDPRSHQRASSRVKLVVLALIVGVAMLIVTTLLRS